MHTSQMWPLAEVDDSIFGRHMVFEPCLTLSIPTNETVIWHCENWGHRWLVSERLGYDRSLTSQRWAQLWPYENKVQFEIKQCENWTNRWLVSERLGYNCSLTSQRWATLCPMKTKFHLGHVWTHKVWRGKNWTHRWLASEQLGYDRSLTSQRWAQLLPYENKVWFVKPCVSNGDQNVTLI